MNGPLLTSQRITLRALEPIDVDILYTWENDSSLWCTGVTIAPYSRKQLWDYVNNYDADIFSAKQLRLMIELTNSKETIGTLDLCEFDPINSRCGIGILIAKGHQAKGYGAEALRLVENYCRTRLSLHQLYCTVAESNLHSRHLFEKVGYRISGRLKSWLKSAGVYTDAYLYQKML